LGDRWGGQFGAVIPAVDDRLKASIILYGGLTGLPDDPPESDFRNYLAHVKVPTLILAGRNNLEYPLERAVRPMLNLMGTPMDRKNLIIYEDPYSAPHYEFVKESMAWLDRYLGAVRR
jgi:hypothetical protein